MSVNRHEELGIALFRDIVYFILKACFSIDKLALVVEHANEALEYRVVLGTLCVKDGLHMNEVRGCQARDELFKLTDLLLFLLIVLEASQNFRSAMPMSCLLSSLLLRAQEQCLIVTDRTEIEVEACPLVKG